jgi:hypothetical protein
MVLIENRHMGADMGLIPISAVSAHFLLAAAAVQCTCSGDPSGEGFAFKNFSYMGDVSKA